MNDINIKDLINGFGSNSLEFTQYMNRTKNSDPVLYGQIIQELKNGNYSVSILSPGDGR